MHSARTHADLVGLSTLEGTPQEVSKLLNESSAERVVAVAIAHESDSAIALATRELLAFYESVLKRREQIALEDIVEQWVIKGPASPRLLIEARMVAQSRNAVFEQASWLTAAQVAHIAGFSQTNPSAQPNKWKKTGKIFAVRHHGIDYFPGYALDPDDAYRPLKALAPIIETLAAKKDAWGMAYWFLSVNGLLGGRRPQDVLASDPDQVAAAAWDEVQDIAHG